jgi:uncharacterized membrane protein YhaH (DUF805 family)
MIGAWKDVVTKNYANFSGRLGLPGFWWFVLVNFIIELVLLILVIAVHPIFLVLYIGYALAVIVPSIAAGVRRMHDTGRSGLFVLLGLIPFVGPIILIVLFAQKGQPEANQYGPPVTGAPTPGIQPA